MWYSLNSSAAVPVSTRAEGDKAVGNQLKEVGIRWSTDVADPVERVLAIHESSAAAKKNAEESSLNNLEALGESLSPSTIQLLLRSVASNSESAPLPSNAVLSNVRLTPVPLYIGGAKIEGMVPMSLLAPTQGLNITMLTYCGRIYFGLTADPGLLENPWIVADAIPKALVELQAALAAAALREA